MTPVARSPVAGSSHSGRATSALQRLAEADPAFAALALWIDHRDADEGLARGLPGALDDEAQAPAWTDGRTIYYGPGFETLAQDQQVGVAAHQILHVALRHPARDRAMALRLGGGHDARLFNIAADALVNETLMAAGYALPRPCVTLTPLHAFLIRDPLPAAQALAKWDVEALTLALMDAVDRGRSTGEGEGDAPHGAEAAIEAARRAGFASDIDSRGGTEGADDQAEEESSEWRMRLSRALEEGRVAGRGIGALGFRLADLPRSDIPWERHLRGLIARALRPDPRPVWHRPARRWAALEAEACRRGGPAPVYEPGRARSVEVPRIVVGVDTSSSIDDARLGLFLGQVAGMARRSAAELHLLIFDEAVRQSMRLTARGLSASGIEALLKRTEFVRGGGTDFTDLFAQARELQPAMIIVLTDLDAPLPAKPGAIPVIWAVPEKPTAAVTFGRVLNLSF